LGVVKFSKNFTMGIVKRFFLYGEKKVKQTNKPKKYAESKE